MRSIVLVLITAFVFSCAFSPTSDGELQEWTEYKLKNQRMRSRKDYRSPFFEKQRVRDSVINLPCGNRPGFPIDMQPKIVRVDTDLDGEFDHNAWTPGKSKEFDLTLQYQRGEKVEHRYRLDMNLGVAYLVRRSGMSCRIDGDKVMFADDNNNGYFAEFNRDAVYVGNSIYGVPFGQYILLGGQLFEIKLNETGTNVRYRKYKGEWGYADVVSEWGGSKPPEAAIIQARRMLGGTCFNVLEGDEPKVPAAKYQLIGGYLEDVVIESKRARLFFEVEWKQTAKVEWGVGLKLTLPYQYDAETGELNLSPEFEIKGKHGEFYKGAFLNTRKYYAWVRFYDAEGTEIGTKSKWSMDDVEVDPFNTEVMWVPFRKVKPDGAVKVVVTMEVPGVGEAPMEIDLQ